MPATAPEHLQDSVENFRLLVASVLDCAIFMLDPKGHVASWNAGAQRLKGYREDEIIGQHFSRFYPHEDIKRGKPQRGLELASAQGRFEDEGWRVRKNGSTFWANVVIAAIRDKAGDLLGFAKMLPPNRFATSSTDSIHLASWSSKVRFIKATISSAIRRFSFRAGMMT